MDTKNERLLRSSLSHLEKSSRDLVSVIVSRNALHPESEFRKENIDITSLSESLNQASLTLSETYNQQEFSVELVEELLGAVHSLIRQRSNPLVSIRDLDETVAKAESFLRRNQDVN